jgi:hypothetical protein
MPDIFVSNVNKKGQKKQVEHPIGEDLLVMLHSEDLFRELEEEKNKDKKGKTETAKKTTTEPSEEQTIITSPIGPFSSFKVRPKGIHFHEQDEDEQVLLALRKHFVTNIPWILFGTILLALPCFLFYLFTFTNLLQRFIIPSQMLIVLTLAYYLLTLCYLFVSYITWYYNTDLITDKKVVDINFQDIIYHDVAMTKLNLIEDVHYVQSGFFASVFGYGDVAVETAGKTLTFRFESVPNPERIVNLVENLQGIRYHAD